MHVRMTDALLSSVERFILLMCFANCALFVFGHGVTLRMQCIVLPEKESADGSDMAVRGAADASH